MQRSSPGCTSMHFGENQLSPLSIGISPLPTVHPSGLQSTPVRPSTACYGRFSLTMGSSSGFGSTRRDIRAIHTRFRCGSACHSLNRPRRVTRRIILQKARRQAVAKPPGPSTACKQLVSGSISLPSPGYFSPFPHGTVRYRSLRVLSLGRWASQLHAGCLVSGATQAHSRGEGARPLPGYHGLRQRVPGVFACNALTLVPDGSPAWNGFQPRARNACRLDTRTVWANPGSLAATTGMLSVPRGT
jgi:hypothetical protein